MRRRFLKHADVAMYVAKRRGTAFECYDAAQDDNSVRRLALGGELAGRDQQAARSSCITSRRSISEKRPRRGRRGAAALAAPDTRAVSPGEFVAIAESTDLIRPLTEWTLVQALSDVRAGGARGLDIRVAANLSARLLQDTAFPERLRALLESTQSDAASLELEITESAMMHDPARALRIIQEIERLGVRIAIDDFGTGFSSLGYLRDLPVHALKLDKSFVQGMRGSAR